GRARVLSARRAAAFAINEQGLAAIEFAFVLPLMLAIYLGIVELSNGLNASRKVDLVAHAMSDLTGQITGGGAGSGQAAITDAEMQQIFLAGAALIAPLSATSLTITISEVLITQSATGAYQAQVTWSVSYNGGTLRGGQGCTLNTHLNAADVAPVSPISMPTSFTNATLRPALGPVIVADVTYNYNLGLGNLVEAWLPTGAIPMRRTSYSPVRNQYVNPNPGPPELLNHIQSPTTATSWTTAISGSTNVNCLGYLTPAQH
ncbi:MAG TPA: TadE/TadG family type IV pilus assembly protein, partial [Methylocystis sp.]